MAETTRQIWLVPDALCCAPGWAGAKWKGEKVGMPNTCNLPKTKMTRSPLPHPPPFTHPPTLSLKRQKIDLYLYKRCCIKRKLLILTLPTWDSGSNSIYYIQYEHFKGCEKNNYCRHCVKTATFAECTLSESSQPWDNAKERMRR